MGKAFAARPSKLSSLPRKAVFREDLSPGLSNSHDETCGATASDVEDRFHGQAGGGKIGYLSAGFPREYGPAS